MRDGRRRVIPVTRADSGLCVAAGVLLLVVSATWSTVSTVRLPLTETAVAVFAVALAVWGAAGLVAHRVSAARRAPAPAVAAGRARRGTPVRRPVRHRP